MADRPAIALLDTSVVIDLEKLSADQLPEQIAVSAVTMAELAAGPAATDDVQERARYATERVTTTACRGTVEVDSAVQGDG